MSVAPRRAPTTTIDDTKSREDEAWGMIVTRETGRAYFSEYRIGIATKLSRKRIMEMVARCRTMRRALGFDVKLPPEWQTARMTPLDPATA